MGLPFLFFSCTQGKHKKLVRALSRHKMSSPIEQTPSQTRKRKQPSELSPSIVSKLNDASGAVLETVKARSPGRNNKYMRNNQGERRPSNISNVSTGSIPGQNGYSPSHPSRELISSTKTLTPPRMTLKGKPETKTFLSPMTNTPCKIQMPKNKIERCVCELIYPAATGQVFPDYNTKL